VGGAPRFLVYLQILEERHLIEVLSIFLSGWLHSLELEFDVILFLLQKKKKKKKITKVPFFNMRR
jgi:hypothetical protein